MPDKTVNPSDEAAQIVREKTGGFNDGHGQPCGNRGVAMPIEQAIETQLKQWNLKQAPWKPFKRLDDLTPAERMECFGEDDLERLRR